MKKWMKIALSGILILIALIKLVNYFNPPNGKTYEVDKNHHVYYKGDGVTESDAKKTGEYFKQVGLFTADNSMDVQIKAEKITDNVILSFVVDKDKITSELENSALSISSPVSNQIFNGRKVSIALADEDLDEIKNLGFAPTQNQ